MKSGPPWYVLKWQEPVLEQTELNMLIKVLFLLFVVVVAVDANVCPLWLVLIVYRLFVLYMYAGCDSATRKVCIFNLSTHVCCSDLKKDSGEKKIVFLFVGLWYFGLGLSPTPSS